MTRVLYDIETDGLLDAMTRVHCICAVDIDTGVQRAFYDQDLPGAELQPAGTVADGIAYLNAAELRAGHNILGFDEPALERFGLAHRDEGLFDTLTAARVIWPDEHLKALDFANFNSKKGRLVEKQLFGRHSLKAWGFRLGMPKGTFGQEPDAFATLTPEMLAYCAQDVRATHALYKMLTSRIAKGEATVRTIKVENKFARVIDRQKAAGFQLDGPVLDRLVSGLLIEKVEVEARLVAGVPAFVNHYVTPVRKEKKTRTVAFNPTSRSHIVRHFMERLGWVPHEFTDGGKPKLDEDVMDSLSLPGIADFKRLFKIQKVLGMAAEGPKAWTKFLDTGGRVHGYVNHNGAVTGRCTHSSPNVTQVPKVNKDKAGVVLKGFEGGYGWECRSCFVAAPGKVLVGVDASGLELRMLAHYLYQFDGGEYATVVTKGDPHARHASALGKTREEAKRFIYAFLYGAGKVKLSKVLECSVPEAEATKKRFLKNMPALASQLAVVKAAARQVGHVVLPDGRRLHIRHEHAALNTLLQGLGALVMKYAVVRLHEVLIGKGYNYGVDFDQVHMAHDEVQIECRPEIAEGIGQDAVAAIAWAGERLGLHCSLTGTSQIGGNWAQTHG